MKIPSMKRVKVTSPQELDVWLTKYDGTPGSVMLVTHADAAHKDHVSREQVQGVLGVHGWAAGVRYTLNATLLGHVITKQNAR